MKKTTKRVLYGIVALTGLTVAGVKIASALQKKQCKEDSKNPFEGKKVIFVENEEDPENADGVRGHLEPVGASAYTPSFYDKYVKRGLDIVLSFGGIVALSPILLGIAAAIKIDDPGPVFFTQKRLGQNKKYFRVYKFRSMKMSTPHDTPTHMLENPEQYITRVGKFLRAHSLDELPQLFNVLDGSLSLVGPRPGLWNQDVLTAERDKYDVNEYKPGITGWAQINGRDSISIEQKSELDGYGVRHSSLIFDLKCLLGTVTKVGHDDTVVEGGTGAMERTGRNYADGKTKEELIGTIGFGEPVCVDKEAKKKVLITGAGSYIGQSFLDYAKKYYPENFEIDELDMMGDTWRDCDFSNYDIVYHVAGIAHADVGDVSEETKEKYYAVNTDLTVEVAQKAKTEKVKEFIFMSSMIVYGESAPYGKKKVIDEHTVPAPANFYGDSKLQADVAVRELADDSFKVIVLRPPMIYGRGSKGNYPVLAKLAKKLPVFPEADNERSMLYIENLCEFLCQVMLVEQIKQNATVLIPQNAEWTNTSAMVKEIAKVSGKNIAIMKALKPAVTMAGKLPGKIGGMTNKAFGNNCYKHNISKYENVEYQKVNLQDSIFQTESKLDCKNKHILVISQYFYPEQFRVNDICTEWIERGYNVTVVTGIPNYPQGEFYEGYDYNHNRTETWNGVDIIRLPIKPRKSGAYNLAMNYASFVIEGRKWIKNTNLKADEVFVYEVSPMTQALVGVWYAQKNHIKCNIYVTDLWPENVEIVLGIHNKAFIGPIGVMVDYIYKRCDYIFTSSRSFIDKIAARGINNKKIVYWPQYAEDFYHKVEKKESLEIPNDGVTNLTFAGNIGTAQGLDVLVEAAKILCQKEIMIRFNIIGNGRYEEQLKEHIKLNHVENYFNFIERKPADEIPNYFAWSDAALITLAKSEVYSMTIPAKTQSCLACGMPVIVSADGEIQNIIREANCGLCSDAGDSKSLAENILNFVMMPQNQREILSMNALEYYKKNFEKKMLMDRMEEYI